MDVLAGRISLLEFAAHPEIRNLHTAYYGASTVADFDFIGIMEHQDSEMQRLAHILDKPVLSLPRDNVTRSEEYAAFKAEMATLADRPDVRFANLEDLVPADLWGAKAATTLGGGEELDFMHFQAGGHRLLAAALYRELQALWGGEVRP